MSTRVGNGAGEAAHVQLHARTARLFLALKPLYYTIIAYGVLPATVRRWPHAALSFSPLRSTLLWVLLVQASTVVSAWRVWSVSLDVLGDGGPIIQSYPTFPALLAMSHSASLVLLVPIWWEAPRYKKLVAQATTLVGCLDDGVLGVGWPRRRTVVIAWLWTLVLAVASPAVVIVWQFNLTSFGGEVIRVPAHWMANVLVAAIVACLSLVYYIIKDVAESLAQRFGQDASRAPGEPLSCTELLRYRRAWLTLRDMLQGAMFAPATLSLNCALLVVNTMLCMYHVLNSILGGAPLQLLLGLTVSTSQLALLFLFVCLAADGAVDAVAKFARSFESLEPNSGTNYVFAREVFREALSHSPSSVCVGGFWYLNGRTVLSVCLLISTYIIVLVEFRLQGSCPPCGNATHCGGA